MIFLTNFTVIEFTVLWCLSLLLFRRHVTCVCSVVSIRKMQVLFYSFSSTLRFAADYHFEKRLVQWVDSCVSSYLALFSSLIIIGSNCKIDRGYAFTACFVTDISIPHVLCIGYARIMQIIACAVVISATSLVLASLQNDRWMRTMEMRERKTQDWKTRD